MIDFQPLKPEDRERTQSYLNQGGPRGCEYSFANLYMWGRQRYAVLDGYLALFSQYNRKTLYVFPVGSGDIRPVLDRLMEDAAKRGIPCRFTGLTPEDQQVLEKEYPGRFRFHFDRNIFDYVYDINDLADLPGRKFQKKRNHLNRFLDAYPNYQLTPISQQIIPQLEDFLGRWYENQLQLHPHSDFHMEKAALQKAMAHWQALAMEGVVLTDGGQILAMAMGSQISEDTFDIHFEKALWGENGTYAAINREFARYLRGKYPSLRWLNREDDMGIEGLRKAKLSYCPHHLIEKSWAHLVEDGYDY